MQTPNIFTYATSELSQDAAIAYILSWADPGYQKEYPEMNQLGEKLLRKLMSEAAKERGMTDPLSEQKIKSVEVDTQVDHVDVEAIINETVCLIIEDKTFTGQHSNQIARYVKEKQGGKQQVLAVYLKTGNESLSNARRVLRQASQEKDVALRGVPYGLFYRKDLLDVFKECEDTGNTIIEEFRHHLRAWEDKSNEWKTQPPTNWSHSAVEGFYMALDEWWEKEQDVTDEDYYGWHYVTNPSGGFLAFYWHRRPYGPIDGELYLQIETDPVKKPVESVLKVRAYRKRNEGEETRTDSTDLYKALDALSKAAEGSSIHVKKAGTFRGGKWGGGVAILGFEESGKYLAINDDGKVDLEATKEHLKEAMALVSSAAKQTAGDTHEE